MVLRDHDVTVNRPPRLRSQGTRKPQRTEDITMAANRITLTKANIDSAKPQADKFFLWDQKVQGLGVCVCPSGTKSFVLDYTRNKKRRRMKLGEYGAVLLDGDIGARALAREAWGQITKGIDPLGAKEERQNALTVQQMWDA